MASSPEPQVSSTSPQWLGVTEGLAVLGSFGTAIAALTSQQFVAFASLPLSISLALSLANRNRLLKDMDQAHQAQLAQITRDRAADQQVLSMLVSRTEAASMHLVDITHGLEHNKVLAAQNAEQLTTLQSSLTETQELQAEMGDRVEHLQKATAQPDEFYFEEAMAHYQMGELDAAITSLNLAIKANETMAKAYYQRGLFKAEAGQRQVAIADLRTAAGYFFEQGKLEQYQKAKDLSKHVHEAVFNTASNPPEQAPTTSQPTTSQPTTGQSTTDSVAVGNLFN